MNIAEPKYRRILREELSKRVERNPRYSVRSFARNLKLDSGALSQILAGSRVPSEKVAKKLLSELELSPSDRNHFVESLAQTHQKRKLKRVSRYFQEISKELHSETRPSAYRDLSADLFRTIADWHHYAILELTLTEGFKSDSQWIALELGLPVNEVILAVSRLKELGFLDEVKGRLVKTVPPLMTADHHLTTSAHRRRQKQILEKSITAIDSVPIELRNNSAMTMAVDIKKIPGAKKRIKAFLDELSAYLESGEKQKVYEIAVSLIPLQKTERTSL